MVNEYLTPEMINTAITMVIIPLFGLITKYIVIFLKCRISELEQKADNNTLSKYLQIAEDAIVTAVVSVKQTLVEPMKNQGTFDQAAMEKSFCEAKNKALSIMGFSAQEALKSAYTDIDAWLDNKIEFYVNQSKK